MLQVQTKTKGLLSKIYKELSQVNKRNRQIAEEKNLQENQTSQMANKTHEEVLLLLIEEMQTKITMRYHNTPII